ncbi:MAG: hypothetical protein Q4E43_05260, partial [Akkermansia sp.]|nr:hypothetical protein [Akkermansia sp.]
EEPGTHEDPGTQEEAYATGWLSCPPGGGVFLIGGVRVTAPANFTVSAWNEVLCNANVECTNLFTNHLMSNTSWLVMLRALVPGAGGERITLAAASEGTSVSGPTLTLPED